MSLFDLDTSTWIAICAAIAVVLVAESVYLLAFSTASYRSNVNRRLKLTFEGINLTDEFQDQFNDSTNRISFYHHTGREFLFGARFSY